MHTERNIEHYFVAWFKLDVAGIITGVCNCVGAGRHFAFFVANELEAICDANVKCTKSGLASDGFRHDVGGRYVTLFAELM